MAFPDDQLTAPIWIDGIAMNAVQLDKIRTYLNSLAGRVSQSGDRSSGISITPATGWGSITQDWEIANGWINLELTATRTGSGITGPSNGNLANNLVATLNDHKPSRRQIGSYAPAGGGGETSLNPLGQWYLLSLMPTAVIATGDVAVALFSYPI